jgi:hypothetical protein
VNEPWHPGETPDEQDARRMAYERLAAAARRVGLTIEQLGGMLGQVAHNEAETRRFLAEQVYDVPDEHLDEYLRVRLKDLGTEGRPDGG